MIAQLFSTLRSAMLAKGVPYAEDGMVYGPTAVPLKIGATRVVMMRDYDAQETIGPGRARTVNPIMMGVRSVPGVVRIYASSTISGATRGDHETLADAIADQVHVEIYKAILNLKTKGSFTRAGLVSDETPDGWLGVIYELRFTVDRGVYDTDWLGNAAGQMTMTAKTAVNAPPSATGDAAATKTLPQATTRIE